MDAQVILEAADLIGVIRAMDDVTEFGLDRSFTFRDEDGVGVDLDGALDDDRALIHEIIMMVKHNMHTRLRRLSLGVEL